MTRAGTLPLRKPFTVTCWLIFLYAASRLGLSSSKGTSTVSRTRVGFRVSTALFTVGFSLGLTSGFGLRRPVLRTQARTWRRYYVVGVAGFEPTTFRSQSG